MRVLALLKYADLAASTRQRFIQYEPHLAAAGITALRNGERVSTRAAATSPTMPTAMTGRLPYTVAARPASGAATAIEPQFNERMVPFILARNRSGVTALR